MKVEIVYKQFIQFNINNYKLQGPLNLMADN